MHEWERFTWYGSEAAVVVSRVAQLMLSMMFLERRRKGGGLRTCAVPWPPSLDGVESRNSKGADPYVSTTTASRQSWRIAK